MRRLLLIFSLIVGLFPLLPDAAPSQTQDRETKFRLAQALERGGEYERAASLYQELMSGDPRNPIFLEALQRVWMQLKRYDDIAVLLRSRLLGSRADVVLRTTLGTVLYRGGKETEAVAEWDSALAVDPANANTYRIVASALIENRLLDRAVGIYRRGREATKDPDQFTLELAQTLAAGMDFESATTEYVRWLRRNPVQVAVLQSRLSAWSGREEARSAAVGVVRAEINKHEDLSLLTLLAWLLMEGKAFDQAFDVERRIDELSHAGGSVILQFAEQAYHARAYDIAARAYREAITIPLSPEKLPAAEYGEACALNEIGSLSDTVASGAASPTEAQPRLSAAMAQFRSIMEKYPRSEFAARSEFEIGIMQYDRLADLDGALASFEHVLAQTAQTNVFRFDVELMIGRLHITRGDTARAVTRFADVAAAPGALPDQSDEAAFHLAEIDYFGGRFGDAAKRLEGIVVNLKADYANDALRFQSFLQENIKVAPEALREYARADFLARQGKKTEAVALMRDVVARYPRTPLVDDALMCIGGLQFSAGFYADAVATYERLLTDFRENSILLDRAQFQLAETYEAGMRDTLKAIAAYEKLLADYPSSVLADEARRRIRRLRGEAL